MAPEMAERLAICLCMYGWQRRGPIEYFYDDGHLCVETVFCNDEFTSSAFALGPLINRRKKEYAAWGYYREGTLTDWGFDECDLLAFLSRLYQEAEDVDD